ncbi:hypothetical protein BGZ94_009632, partial [Podila epigama]
NNHNQYQHQHQHQHHPHSLPIKDIDGAHARYYSGSGTSVSVNLGEQHPREPEPPVAWSGPGAAYRVQQRTPPFDASVSSSSSSSSPSPSISTATAVSTPLTAIDPIAAVTKGTAATSLHEAHPRPGPQASAVALTPTHPRTAMFRDSNSHHDPSYSSPQSQSQSHFEARSLDHRRHSDHQQQLPSSAGGGLVQAASSSSSPPGRQSAQGWSQRHSPPHTTIASDVHDHRHDHGQGHSRTTLLGSEFYPGSNESTESHYSQQHSSLPVHHQHHDSELAMQHRSRDVKSYPQDVQHQYPQLEQSHPLSSQTKHHSLSPNSSLHPTPHYSSNALDRTSHYHSHLSSSSSPPLPPPPPSQHHPGPVEQPIRHPYGPSDEEARPTSGPPYPGQPSRVPNASSDPSRPDGFHAMDMYPDHRLAGPRKYGSLSPPPTRTSHPHHHHPYRPSSHPDHPPFDDDDNNSNNNPRLRHPHDSRPHHPHDDPNTSTNTNTSLHHHHHHHQQQQQQQQHPNQHHDTTSFHPSLQQQQRLPPLTDHVRESDLRPYNPPSAAHPTSGPVRQAETEGFQHHLSFQSYTPTRQRSATANPTLSYGAGSRLAEAHSPRMQSQQQSPPHSHPHPQHPQQSRQFHPHRPLSQPQTQPPPSQTQPHGGPAPRTTRVMSPGAPHPYLTPGHRHPPRPHHLSEGLQTHLEERSPFALGGSPSAPGTATSSPGPVNREDRYAEEASDAYHGRYDRGGHPPSPRSMTMTPHSVGHHRMGVPHEAMAEPTTRGGDDGSQWSEHPSSRSVRMSMSEPDLATAEAALALSSVGRPEEEKNEEREYQRRQLQHSQYPHYPPQEPQRPSSQEGMSRPYHRHQHQQHSYEGYDRLDPRETSEASARNMDYTNGHTTSMAPSSGHGYPYSPPEHGQAPYHSHPPQHQSHPHHPQHPHPHPHHQQQPHPAHHGQGYSEAMQMHPDVQMRDHERSTSTRPYIPRHLKQQQQQQHQHPHQNQHQYQHQHAPVSPPQPHRDGSGSMHPDGTGSSHGHNNGNNHNGGSDGNGSNGSGTKMPIRRGPYLSRNRALLAGLAASSASGRYKCQYCSKRFSRPSSLRIHTYSHTGERPFKCSEEGCGRQFSVQSNMRRHLRVHRISRLKSGIVDEGEEEEEEDEMV